MTVTLLGPQRFNVTVPKAVRSLDVDGPVATVTAGWQEREPDDAELDDLLDGRSLNLALYRRWLDVSERDPGFGAAQRRSREILDELHDLYVVRLDHAVEAVYDVARRGGHPQVHNTALADAVVAVRALDERHYTLVAEVHAEFADTVRPHERPVVAEHRAAVAAALDRCAALAIAGGHVGVLLTCLQLFDVAGALGDVPVVAWSAGAMAVSERVVLFHDRAPEGRAYAEVYDAGLALCRGVVPLPHARRRLRLDDPIRVALFAQRFAPARCVVLDDGMRLELDGATECCPPGTRVLTEEGHVAELGAAA
ncbi:MAG: hypothetical protein M3O86_03245 [Actinomycetota bacterium]|nr:hypothetical protein [Actinomycetota bacterium]